MVGRKKASRSETVVHFAEIRSARHDVVVRIKGVDAQSVSDAQFNPGAWHDLHQPESASGDMARPSPALSSCMTPRIHCAGIANRAGCLGDKGCKEIDRCRRARSNATSVLRGSPPALASDSTPSSKSAGNGFRNEEADGQRHVQRPARVKAGLRRPRGGADASLRATGVADVAVDRRMVLRSNEQGNDRKFGIGDHGHSSLVHTGSALPMTDGLRERPKVAAVQRVFRLPVHEKDFVRANDATSLPDRQGTAAAVASQRFSHLDRIDGDRQPFPADRLSRKRQHALEHGNADRQVAVQIEKGRKRLGRSDGHELGDGQALPTGCNW